MQTISYVSNSLRSAGRELRLSLAHSLQQLSHEQFIRAWSAVAYLFPGLHPDGYEDADSGWPTALKRFAAEAWRRADAGELADEEFVFPQQPSPVLRPPSPAPAGEGQAMERDLRPDA